MTAGNTCSGRFVRNTLMCKHTHTLKLEGLNFTEWGPLVILVLTPQHKCKGWLFEVKIAD